MPLANPTPVRLAQDQLQWLDSWRGDRLSRGAAIRQLVDRMMRLQEADSGQSRMERR
jgi:hypothetical protein